MGSGKPRGIRAGRKLLTDRREQRWASKRYKKANLGTQFKCNPFGGSSHCKGIVLEKIGIEAKQPNSAIRKCVRAQLIKNGKKIAAFVPNDGCLNFVDENVRAAALRADGRSNRGPRERIRAQELASDECTRARRSLTGTHPRPPSPLPHRSRFTANRTRC
jgi:ribosomal protein uS12